MSQTTVANESSSPTDSVKPPPETSVDPVTPNPPAAKSELEATMRATEATPTPSQTTPESSEPSVVISPKVDPLFLSYVHQQTLRNEPIDLGKAVEQFNEKGIPFSKTKETKQYLLRLFDHYSKLFEFIQSLPAEKRTREELGRHSFSFSLVPYESIISDLLASSFSTSEVAKEAEPKTTPPPASEAIPKKATDKKPEPPQETSPPTVSDDKPIPASPEAPKANTESPPPAKLPSAKPKVAEEPQVKPREAPSPLLLELEDASVVVPELNAVLLSYGVDLTLAQYRDAARDLRYMLLTYIDLYKDTRLIQRTVDFIQEALQVLSSMVKQYEQGRDLYSEEEIDKQQMGIREHPEQAYRWLMEYYQMLQSVYVSLLGGNRANGPFQGSYHPIFLRLQHHLSSLRMKSPSQIEEYKRTIQISHPLPTQRMISASAKMKAWRRTQWTKQDLPKELVYYCILAVYDHNPLLIVEDPLLERLLSQFPETAPEFSELFLSLTPEQRLQFISILHERQPFDKILRKRTELLSVIPLLQKFIHDNPVDSGCEALRQAFEIESQALQSDLKRWIIHWGEDIASKAEDYLRHKYDCGATDASPLSVEQREHLRFLIQKGLAGQVALLHQLYQHYPSVTSVITLRDLLQALTQQVSNEFKNPPSSAEPDQLQEDQASRSSSLFHLHQQLEDRHLSAEHQLLKQRMLRLRDFFNSAENRTRMYQILEQIKKRHPTFISDGIANPPKQDLEPTDPSPLIRRTIIDLLPEAEDPLRVFLINFLDLYGSLDKIPLAKPDSILDLKQLRHLSSDIQHNVIRRASFFLLGTSLHLETQAYTSLRDQAILHHIEYLLYSPTPESVVSFIEERVHTLSLPTSFPEFQHDIQLLKSKLIRQVKKHHLEEARHTLHLLLTLTRSKIMQDPFAGSRALRKQRFQSRSLAEQVASRLPPLPVEQKQRLLWWILKPWMDHMSHTEYRHFEYFLALPPSLDYHTLPFEVRSFFGTPLPPHELGFVDTVKVYRPTLHWWSYFIQHYGSQGSTATNETKLIEEMTIEGGPTQRFVMGLFAPGYTAHILTARDFKRERAFFASRLTSGQQTYHQWLQQPLQRGNSLESSLRSYLEQLIHPLFTEAIHTFEKSSPETSLNPRKIPREQMRASVFVQAVFEASQTIGDVLRTFFRVYTFLSSKSLVFGYARSILGSFERSPPGWYRYLVRFSILELFPELTLVDPSIQEQIIALIDQHIEKQVRRLFVESYESMTSSDLTPLSSLDVNDTEEQRLTHLLQHEVRPYVQTKWCPVERATAQYLCRGQSPPATPKCTTDGTIVCYSPEQDPHIPTPVLQAIKAQLSTTDGTSTPASNDLTLDTDIEMTAIRYFTDIVRDATVRSGELMSSRLAREIAKAHPHPITGKQVPVEPIRERLQTIAQSHFQSLLKQLIAQYVQFHSELRYQLDRERTQRYKHYAIQGLDLSVAENDREGRKALLTPLFQTIRSAFELSAIDEDQIVQSVQFALSDQQRGIELSREASDELPTLCGLCQKPSDKMRLSYFYKQGIAEPEFFCSLQCADDHMSKYQEEPEDLDVKIKGDEALFLQLLRFYPNKGHQEAGEDGLYLPEKEILLHYEEPIRALATTISEELATEPDVEAVYRGIVHRYRSQYDQVLSSRKSDFQKRSVFVVDGCDITLRQIKEFIRQFASQYYDQVADGQFHFVDGVNHPRSLMSDFYQSFPQCSGIPTDVRQSYQQFKLIKRLAEDIERAYRLVLGDSSELERIQKVTERLQQIYKWRYLRQIKRTYPYLSDTDHLKKVEEQLTTSPPSKDVEVALVFLNKYAPIDQRLHSTQELLQELDKITSRNTGRNRLMRLLQVRGVTFGTEGRSTGFQMDLDQYTQSLALMRQIATIFPEELQEQIRKQKIVVRRSREVISSVTTQEQVYSGIARKGKREAIKVLTGQVQTKQEYATANSELEETILHEQLVTLKQQIEHELRDYM